MSDNKFLNFILNFFKGNAADQSDINLPNDMDMMNSPDENLIDASWSGYFAK